MTTQHEDATEIARRPAVGNGAQAPAPNGVPAVGPGPAPASVTPLPPRDVRRKRPPALSFLLRMETFRRFCRVVSLLVLDYIGVSLAIITALVTKAAVRDDTIHW